MLPNIQRELVLCYGCDATLISTRQKVLETICLPTVVALSRAEFEEEILTLNVAAVLLCHSLTDDDCRAAAEYVRENSPRTKVVLLHSWYPRRVFANMYPQVNTGAGPIPFLLAVKRLMPDTGSDWGGLGRTG